MRQELPKAGNDTQFQTNSDKNDTHGQLQPRQTIHLVRHHLELKKQSTLNE